MARGRGDWERRSLSFIPGCSVWKTTESNRPWEGGKHCLFWLCWSKGDIPQGYKDSGLAAT